MKLNIGLKYNKKWIKPLITMLKNQKNIMMTNLLCKLFGHKWSKWFYSIQYDDKECKICMRVKCNEIKYRLKPLNPPTDEN